MQWTHLIVAGTGATTCGVPTAVSTPEHPLVVSDSPANVTCPLCLRVLAFELEAAL